MYATERVEGEWNEAKVVLVTVLLVRLDVVVVEHLKGRQGTGLSLSPVINISTITSSNWILDGSSRCMFFFYREKVLNWT